MARSQLTVDLRTIAGFKKSAKKFSELRSKFENMDQLLQDLADKMELNYIEPMITELRKVPAKRSYPEDYPIVFSTLKQQRFVMAKLNGQPYKRKGNLTSGYQYSVKIIAGKISFKLENSDPKHKYVVGKWGLGTSTTSIRRYTKDIQSFHAVTGWKPAYKTVQKYMLPAKEEAVATIKQWLTSSP